MASTVPRSFAPCLRAAISLLPLGLALAGSVWGQQSSTLGTLVVTAALVGDNLEIKPVPLHTLALIPTTGAGEAIPFRTGLDGKANQEAPSGLYRVASETTVTLAGRRYRWDLEIRILAGRTVVLELTNANAQIDSSSVAVVAVAASAIPPGAAPAPSGGRQMAPEVEVYQRVRAGVFRVEAGLSRGSGFLVDSAAGLVFTNAHVVDGVPDASLVLDSVTRIPAQIIYRDHEADVAVLQAAPKLLAGRPVLALANPAPGMSLVEPGERLFAVGYPLHQEQTLTSGIASSVREGAIISDVNINHGNSGGPMLNLAGDVVAINTFGDLPQNGGPGVSGSIVISRALRALAAARDTLPAFGPPYAEPLPLLPRARYSVTALKAIADSASPRRYDTFDRISAGRFEVSVTTPVIAYVRRKAFEAEIGKDRKKREAKGKVEEDQRYSEMREMRDWDEYVGDDRVPVISIAVMPKVGETDGSVFRRLLVTGVGGKATYRYKGDLRDARIFRNGEQVLPIVGGRTPVKQYIDNAWVDLKDVADMGYYILPVETFAPEPDGTPPVIVLDLLDLKNMDVGNCRILPAEVVGLAWNDFERFQRDQGLPFVRADANKKRQMENPRSVCTPSTPSTDRNPGMP